MTIHVCIPVYDCHEYLTKCLATVAAQDHDDMRVVVIDDCSPDERQRAMVRSVNTLPGWLGHVNDDRRFCPRNIWDAVRLANPDPDDVIYLLDGDDWMPDTSTIARVAAIYDDPDVWMTVGGYEPCPPDPGCHMPQPYPPDVIYRGGYRTHGLHEFNHPLTFRAHLWDAAVEPADLQFDDGTWFTGAYDMAICMPLLECAGYHHRCITDDVLYVYRADNSASDALIHRDEVLDASRVIASRPAKSPLDPAHRRQAPTRPVRVRRTGRRRS